MKKKIVGIVITSILIVGIILLLVLNFCGVLGIKQLAEMKAYALPAPTSNKDMVYHTFYMPWDLLYFRLSAGYGTIKGMAPQAMYVTYNNNTLLPRIYIGDQYIDFTSEGGGDITVSTLFKTFNASNTTVDLGVVYTPKALPQNYEPFLSFDNVYISNVALECYTNSFELTFYFAEWGGSELPNSNLTVEFWDIQDNFAGWRSITPFGLNFAATSPSYAILPNGEVTGWTMGSTTEAVTLYEQGHSVGYNIGYEGGYTDGMKAAQRPIYDAGYEAGYKAGQAVGNGVGTTVEAGKSLLSSVLIAMDTPLLGENISVLSIVAIVVVLGLVLFVIKLIRS